MATELEVPVDDEPLTCSLEQAARELGYSAGLIRKMIGEDVAEGRVSKTGMVLAGDPQALAFPLPWTRIGRRYRVPRYAVDRALGKTSHD